MDLSDPNRPLKLAEKFTEIYDNQWNIAMEKLEGVGVDEEKGIKILLEIITVNFSIIIIYYLFYTFLLYFLFTNADYS